MRQSAGHPHIPKDLNIFIIILCRPRSRSRNKRTRLAGKLAGRSALFPTFSALPIASNPTTDCFHLRLKVLTELSGVSWSLYNVHYLWLPKLFPPHRHGRCSFPPCCVRTKEWCQQSPQPRQRPYKVFVFDHGTKLKSSHDQKTKNILPRAVGLRHRVWKNSGTTNKRHVICQNEDYVWK